MPHRQPKRRIYGEKTYLDVEEVLHSIQNLQRCVGHDLQAIWRCLLHKRRDSLVRGRAVIRFVARTNKESGCAGEKKEKQVGTHVSVTCSSAPTIPSKYGESGPVFCSSLDSYNSYSPSARFIKAQQQFAMICGLSCKPATMALTSACKCTSGLIDVIRFSQMRPSVQAVVSFTCGCESVIILIKSGKAWLTSGVSTLGSGPTRIEPKDITAASR